MHALIEARRAAPAILYLPHLQVTLSYRLDSLRKTCATMPRRRSLATLAAAGILRLTTAGIRRVGSRKHGTVTLLLRPCV